MTAALAGCCAALILVVGAFVLRTMRRGVRMQADLPLLPRAFPDAMPARVLWAWEEPEDLQALAPQVGVAYLAETLLLGERIAALPRRQPLSPAADAPLMAVVRIETRPGFSNTPALQDAVAARIADAAARGSVRALQIDFDATLSQRAFYAGVIRQVRTKLPARMPLSITALASWCGTNSWLHDLPIDEAVPMLFRMGGPRALDNASSTPLVEPRCRTSLGLATDEPWPRALTATESPARVYHFAPSPWRPQQLAAAAASPLPSLRQELVR